MRLKLLLVGLGAAFLLLTSFSPGTLPFNPGARYSDAATSHWGAASYLRESVLVRREFPVWRETIMAGAPFAANPLNKTAYPLQWLVLILPPALHLNMMIVLHLLFAGAGMWWWARSLGLRSGTAGFSTLAYALSPRLIGHTGAGHLDLLYAAACFPFLMAALQKFVTSEKVSWKFVIWIAVFAGLIFLADTRLALFAFATAGAYGLYETAQAKQWKRLIWLVPAALLFLLLTVSVTVPLFGWSPYLSRAGLSAAEAGEFSLEPAHFIGMILPPQSGNIEMLTFVGLPVLALGLIALLVMPRKLWFWAALLAIAMLYALGENGILWTALIQVVPSLGWFRVPSRAWFIVALILPLLAGYGLQWLFENADRLRRARWQLYVLAGLVGSFACGVFTILALPLPDAAGWSVLIGGGGLSVSVLLLISRRLSAEQVALLILMVTLADLQITGRSWLEWRGEEDWLKPYEPLAQSLIEDSAARVYSPTYSLPQEVAEAYNLELFGGVDPFQIEGVVAVVAQAGGIVRSGYSVVVPPLNDIEEDDPATANQTAFPDTELLAEWEVSHVVAAYPINHPRLELIDEIDGTFIYRNRDFTEASLIGAPPNWSANGAGLPSREIVVLLNQLTVVAAVISWVSLLVCFILLLKLRR
jgi:hypothetical protein